MCLNSAVIAAKAQVWAQFGGDSYEVTMVGLKRTSDHKPRARKVIE